MHLIFLTSLDCINEVDLAKLKADDPIVCFKILKNMTPKVINIAFYVHF